MNHPVIQCTPTPSDAELAADRDRKHAIEEQHWLDADDRRIAAARNAGWYAAFAAVQHVLVDMIDEASAKITDADHHQADAGDPFVRTLKTLHFGQRVALLAASEKLAHLANSRQEWQQ